jgi:hypothetical protein
VFVTLRSATCRMFYSRLVTQASHETGASCGRASTISRHQYHHHSVHSASILKSIRHKYPTPPFFASCTNLLKPFLQFATQPRSPRQADVETANPTFSSPHPKLNRSPRYRADRPRLSQLVLRLQRDARAGASSGSPTPGLAQTALA